MNELDELVDQWPRNQSRTVALLAVRQVFFDSGAVHWAVEMVADEDQENAHALMLNERRYGQRFDPEKAARHAQTSRWPRRHWAKASVASKAPQLGKGRVRPRRLPHR